MVEGSPAVSLLMCFNFAWVGEDERALGYVENIVASLASHTATLSLRRCNMACALFPDEPEISSIEIVAERSGPIRQTKQASATKWRQRNLISKAG